MTMVKHSFSAADESLYRRQGYVIVPELFLREQIAWLAREVQTDWALDRGAQTLDDAQGRKARFTLWYDLEDDLYSCFIRSERIIAPMEQLMRGPCYHYHSKVIFKEPGSGAWLWHQDYGYWYNYGFLRPGLVSCMVAIDAATRENGCFRVLAGSQQMGRVEHQQLGEQLAADPERVRAAEQRYPAHDVELRPGDAVFFHCNLLHGSPANTSNQPRACLIASYNACDNLPYAGFDSGRPRLQNKQPRATHTERLSTAAIDAFVRRRAERAAQPASRDDVGAGE
jgi:ectoine hydroxylase-related dioxygenase (phytanoyl-CoA dioxygenase family)